MRTLVLPLFNFRNRPSFEYKSNGIIVSALIDTGAETPVWCRGIDKFVEAYPGAVKMKYDSEIRGFGRDPEKGSVFIIPEFVISDGKENYVIKNLQLVVCDHPLIGYDFVLSDTMFSKTDTNIHRIGNKYIEIVFEKDIYQCAAKRGKGTFSIITFAQEGN